MLSKTNIAIITLFLFNMSLADDIKVLDNRPADIINVKTIIPQLQVDMRYYGIHNFIGRRVVGYEASNCLLTKKAATALKAVENKLLPMRLTLKVYDCYRPQIAVDDFITWANDVNNAKMQAEFYPTVDKHDLFKDGYVARKSAHSRGSTMDLTIVSLDSDIPSYNPITPLVSCTLPKNKRFPDNSLDFGSGFDCFSNVSHPDYLGVNPQARSNRVLLKVLMEDAGFTGLATEWWHFTLKNEPYPKTYFNFPVN